VFVLGQNFAKFTKRLNAVSDFMCQLQLDKASGGNSIKKARKDDWTFDTDRVRRYIDRMRSKVKTKFARKNKKGIVKEYYGPL
jgi:hypothetical protein